MLIVINITLPLKFQILNLKVLCIRISLRLRILALLLIRTLPLQITVWILLKVSVHLSQLDQLLISINNYYKIVNNNTRIIRMILHQLLAPRGLLVFKVWLVCYKISRSSWLRIGNRRCRRSNNSSNCNSKINNNIELLQICKTTQAKAITVMTIIQFQTRIKNKRIPRLKAKLKKSHRNSISLSMKGQYH